MPAADSFSPQAPVVTLVQPGDDNPTDHHGPYATNSMGLALGDGAKPRYFQNPWKSWRGPSFGDAWTAYQKGAAIALPLDRTAKKMRDPIERAEHSDEDQDGIPDEHDPRSSDGSIRETEFKPIPARVYVRPEFSAVHEDDEESAWNDPPLEVVQPKWEDRDEVDVTWLGHAGTLVRVPWKEVDGKKRGGSCGVLFDPIFSYR